MRIGLYMAAVLAAWVAQGALAQTASPPAAPVAGPETRFTARDLFDLSMASDPQISPDGSRIAYVRVSNDIMTDRARRAIWLVDTKTGEQVPLAASPDASAFVPVWSPDGTRIAYVSAEGGSAQLWVKWLKGGEAVRLTGLPNSPPSITWSLDGAQIAYTMLVPGEGPKSGKAPDGKPEGAKWAEPLEVYDLLAYRADGAGYLKPGFEKLFIIPATGGAPRQLTFDDYHDTGPLAFAKDGKKVYFSANRKPDW